MGRYISPPNPVLGEKDRMPVAELEQFVGRVGRTLTPLRPVGTCEFEGRRVECLAEYGMIERNVRVEGVRLVDRSLSVKPTADPADEKTTV
jgi:membrane-bound ClpP family serine protease